MTIKIQIVCATRVSRSEFYESTALGRSLRMYQHFLPFDLDLYESNARGLPEVFNESIERARNQPAPLMFVHDDVHLSDFFWYDNICQGLSRFDLIGVAGNRRRVPGQISWAFVNDQMEWDSREHLSGVIGHGHGFPSSKLSFYGPTGQPCKLLDGVLLIAHSQTLHSHNVRFDTRFDFHFYDMDLCRQFEMKGLSMGTWPIGVIHESEGAIRSPAWQLGRSRYQEKYKD